MNSLETYSLHAASFLGLVGIVFMLTCHVMWHPLFAAATQRHKLEHKLDSKEFAFWSAAMTHCCFVLGMIAFGFGFTSACMAVGLPAPLAVFSGMQAPMSQLAYMVINGQSPIGLPDVHGPPIVPRVILIIVEFFMIYATYQNASAGVYDSSTMNRWLVAIAISLVIPNVIAMKHRARGWDKPAFKG